MGDAPRPIGTEFEARGLVGYGSGGAPYASRNGLVVTRWRVVGHAEAATSARPDAPGVPAEKVSLVESRRYPVIGLRLVDVPVCVREDGTPVVESRWLPVVADEAVVESAEPVAPAAGDRAGGEG